MFRFPDKPTRSSPLVLPALPDHTWLAQVKYDGWRTLVRWDGHAVSLTSREQIAIPASPAMLDELCRVLRDQPPLLLDGEWMGRRDGCGGGRGEFLWLFDQLEFREQWQGGLSADSRWLQMTARFGLANSPMASLVPCITHGYQEFYEASKALPGAEGIVLKHRQSKFIGSTRNCADNPMWLKCKWREGSDGHRAVPGA